jgi:transcriptional regulator with XRE-family HTH domain
MKDGQVEALYREFGKLMRLHREAQDGLTQESLGKLVGLSRTSITNIEKGRQPVALHQLFALAQALRVQPAALLPNTGANRDASWVKDKLPPDIPVEIQEWVGHIIRK